MTDMRLKPSIRQRALAGAWAGICGGLAHAFVNDVDRRIFRYDADDLIMLAGPFIADKTKARRIGLCMHLGLAMAFGASYAVVLNPHGRKDAIRKGIAAALIENTTLWPIVVPVDTYHPYIRDGRIDRFNHPISFLQANLRHVALGLGLGMAYPNALERVSN